MFIMEDQQTNAATRLFSIFELIENIFSNLQSVEDSSTLFVAARINRCCYGIVQTSSAFRRTLFLDPDYSTPMYSHNWDTLCDCPGPPSEAYINGMLNECDHHFHPANTIRGIPQIIWMPALMLRRSVWSSPPSWSHLRSWTSRGRLSVGRVCISASSCTTARHHRGPLSEGDPH